MNTIVSNDDRAQTLAGREAQKVAALEGKRAYYAAAGMVHALNERWDVGGIVWKLREATESGERTLGQARGTLEIISVQYPKSSLDHFDRHMNYIGSPADRVREWDQRFRATKRQPSYDLIDEAWIAVGNFEFPRLVHGLIRDGLLDAKHAALAADLAWTHCKDHARALTRSQWALLWHAVDAKKLKIAA